MAEIVEPCVRAANGFRDVFKVFVYGKMAVMSPVRMGKDKIEIILPPLPVFLTLKELSLLAFLFCLFTLTKD